MGTSFRAACAVLLAFALSASCVDTERPGASRSAPLTRSPAVAARDFEATPSGFVTTHGAWTARVAHDGGVELAARGAAGAAMLRVETLAIGRGHSAPLAPARVTASGNAVHIEREAATEVVSRHPRGIEQTWRFAEMPAGGGALEVVLNAAGAAFAEGGPEGLRFVAAEEGISFRYGVATWIDADGRTTPVATLGEGATIRIRVPEAVLESSRYPAVLDPILSVETELDPLAIYVPAPLAQHRAHTATDGVDALVVWQDGRDAPFEVFGTGVNGTGNAYQRANVRLAQSGFFDPKVAYLDTDANGNRRYVMVTTNQFDIEATPITMAATGAITAGDPVNLYTPPPGVFAGVMDVAASAQNGEYLIAYHAGNSGGTLAHVATFSFDHAPIAGPVQLYTAGFPNGFAARAVAVNDSYIVTSRDSSGGALRARVLSSALVVQNNFEVTAEGNQASDPSIAFNGNSALIAWVDRRAGEHIWGRRLDAAGFTSNEFLISGAGETYLTHVIAGDTALDDFFVVWLGNGTIEDELVGATVSASNVVVTFASGAPARRPHGVRVGGVPLVAYDEGFGTPPPDTSDIYTRRFTGSWTGPDRTSEEANRQTDLAVDVAADGSGLVVWTDTRQGPPNTDIHAIYVDASGAPTGGLITVSNDVSPEAEVDVAAGDGEAIVVWRRGDDTPSGSTTTTIMAALIDDAGTLLDTAPIATVGVNRFPRIVHDGAGYAVTWQTGVFSCEAFCQFFEDEPMLVRLTTQGGTITTGLSQAASESGLAPNLAALPNGGVLWLWEHAGDVHAARVLQGVVGAPIAIASGPGRQSRPAAAADADSALVAFEDDRAGGSQIYAALLGADDAVQSLGPVSGAIEAREPEVVDADDGYSFLVVWDGSAFGAPEQIWGGWVKKDGTLVDPVPRQLTDNEHGASRHPDLTALGAGHMLIGFDAVGAERSERAHTVAVGSGLADGETCGGPDDCASRFCTDEVCCSSSCTGQCERCGDDGACLAVHGEVDDSCFAFQSCDESGICNSADGQACVDGADCASGFCVDNVCCENACAGDCDKCGGEAPGICVTEACGLFGCHPDKTCRETCSDSQHCLAGFQCVDGDCVTPPDIRVVDVGCGCHVVGEQRHAGWGWLLALAPLFRRRKKAGT